MNLHFPEILPISDSKDDIISAIRSHQVVVVAGDTGSGKTTQLPKMCLMAGRGDNGLIGCTQPRRIAAVSVAERVQEEIGIPELVGYKIRFNDQTSQRTRIKFMTDGVLLAETRSNRTLSQYDTIIIDEAHERSLNIDFLLGYLHQLLPVRKDLKLIISSATMDTEKFSRHFSNAPILEVSGRTYPVTYQYGPAETATDDELNMVEQAVREVITLADTPGGGDILVFMPTERDINDTVALLRKKLTHPALVLPLFGRLQGADQRKIFQPSSLRKIIVATNVAETSITVPGIQAVVDTGVARIAQYNVRAGTTSLPVQRISRASCEQRAGRCGRTGPGTCVRLYSEEDYRNRREFTLPELLRSNLAEVILQMISLGLGDPRKFPFLEPPAPRAINDGYRILRELGAISVDNHLTKRGKIMAGLPLDPRLSRMIIAGAELGALREIIIIASILSIQDPRIRPAEKIEQAKQAHQKFNHPGSDVLGFVKLWDSCKNAMQGRQQAKGLRKFCKQNFCSWQRMREWFDIHDQILRIIKQHKEYSINDEPAPADAVHQALTAGFLRNIGMRKKKNVYQISSNREAVIFPGSSLYNTGGQWIVTTEFVQTSQLFARVVANIQVDWLEKLGGDLCKTSWSDPRWNKKSGQVIALEKVSLFGLVLTSGRRVNYGRINRQTALEAREIFIHEALIKGNISGNYPFLKHNLAMAEQFAGMENKMRRRGIVMDEHVLFSFYDTRLGRVYDRFTLNRFLKKKKSDKFLQMNEDDICKMLPESDELYRFPDTLQTNQGPLKLSYLFQPGHDADGVTVDIPMHTYSSLSPEIFEWLVPGLLEEKIFFLLKGLPKKLRKLFVPLPDAVDQIMDGLSMYQDSLYPALERVIQRRFQVTLTRADWQLGNLPAHLLMRFRLYDEQGKTRHCCRSFHNLQPYCQKITQTSTKKKHHKLPEQDNITSWNFSSAPEIIIQIENKNVPGTVYYPTVLINDEKSGLNVRYITDEKLAAKQNRRGLRFLFDKEFSKEKKALKKECKAAVAGHSASWLSLGMKATAAEISKKLTECILDNIFPPTDQLPDKKQFQFIVSEVRTNGILRLTKEQINSILELLSTRRKVQVKITKWRQRAAKNNHLDNDLFTNFQQLLDEQLDHNFLTTLKTEEIPAKKKYLQALGLRIERAEHSPEKDNIKAQRLAPFLANLQHLQTGGNTSSACREAIALYRQMVEEFRISVFAPELGTALPVSEKRLKKQWQNLKNNCRTME